MSIFHITDTPDWGQLKINLTSRIHAHPIENARISISYTGVPDETLEELTTILPVRPTPLIFLHLQLNTA